MSVMTTPTHGMAYQAPLGAGEGVKASTSDLSCHFALHIPNIHKKDPQGKPDFKVVFLDMCAPPLGDGEGVKVSRSDLSCHFALFTPILLKKDPQGKPDFVVVFLGMYPSPWGQGRGSKLLEVTFLATLPYIRDRRDRKIRDETRLRLFWSL